MKEPVVIVERDRHGVATVTLNRPEVNNAYDRLVLQALSDGLRICQRLRESSPQGASSSAGDGKVDDAEQAALGFT